MPFKDLMGKAQELTGTATEAAGKFVDEFNEALPMMRALGFTMKDLRVGTGLIPEIGAKLIASTDTMDAKKIKEVIEKNPDNKILTGSLKALLVAYNIKQQIGDLPFKGVEIRPDFGAASAHWRGIREQRARCDDSYRDCRQGNSPLDGWSAESGRVQANPTIPVAATHSLSASSRTRRS